MKKHCVHFVGFRGKEYNSAVKIWGKPDFFHPDYDNRVFHGGEIDRNNDTVIFAKGDEHSRILEFTYNDSEKF